jgi:hypothetical protein
MLNEMLHTVTQTIQIEGKECETEYSLTPLLYCNINI